MEACVVICRTCKPKARKGKILFINAVDEVTRERTQSFLTEDHIKRIVTAYRGFRDEPDFAFVAQSADVRSKNHSLAIARYIDVSSGGRNAVLANGSVYAAMRAYLSSRKCARAVLASVLQDAEPSSSRDSELVVPKSSAPLLRDRSSWVRVRFGDVVENINETESDPASSDLSRFIGLEHIEPGSLHVRTWGNISDGTTFTRRCRPGQVLFGKRRAYLRKVAVAEFDAVVSGDIYVLRPKDSSLACDLLPFICLSEPFLKHAVGTSAGSLSPRTNWESLASFEFELPPVSHQRRIAELLVAIDESLESLRTLHHRFKEQLASQLTAAMDMYVFVTDGRPGPSTLGDLFDERKESGFGHLPILAVTIAGAVVPRESLERSVIDKTGTDKYLHVCPGDLVYNTMRMWQGSCGVVNEEGIVSPAYTVLVPRKDETDPQFWNYAFHTPELLDWFRRFSTGVAADRWRLYFNSFARIRARVPALSVQRELAGSFRLIEDAAQKAQAAISSAWTLLQATVDEFCGDERPASR
jgi:hypothetical protein